MIEGMLSELSLEANSLKTLLKKEKRKRTSAFKMFNLNKKTTLALSENHALPIELTSQTTHKRLLLHG